MSVLLIGGALAQSERLHYSLDGTCPPADSSGNGFDGSCVDSPNTGVAGQFNNAYSFDASNDGIDSTNNVFSPFTGSDSQLSVVYWFKSTTTKNARAFSLQDSDSVPVIQSKPVKDDDGDGDAETVFFASDENDNNVKLVNQVDRTDGNWHMVVANIDGANNNFELWVDNSKVEESTSTGWTGGFYDSINSFSIGYFKNSGKDPVSRTEFFDGSIDEVRVYNGILSSSQIDKLYNDNQLNKPPTFDSVSTDPSSWSLNSDIDVGANVSDSDGSVQSVTADVWENGTQIVSGQSLTNNSGTWEATDLFTVDESDVYYNYSLTATDDDGATSQYKDSQYIENAAPQITVNDPKTKTYATSSIPYNISVSSDGDDVLGEQVNLSLDIDGSKTKDLTASEGNTVSGDFQNVSEGSHTFNVEASDNGGNTSKSVSFSVDTEAPQVDITNPKNTTVYGLTQSVNYSVTDSNLDECWYSVDGGSNQSLPSCKDFTETFNSIGSHQITLYANDSVGNEGYNERSFTVDLKNEINARSSDGFFIQNFSADFDNLELETDNGVIRVDTSELSTGNNSLTVNSEGYKKTSETFNVNNTFQINKSYTLEETVFDFSVKDESTLNKLRPENIEFSKGTDIYSISKKEPDYSVSINFDFQDDNTFQRDGSLNIEPTFVDKVTFTDSSGFDEDFYGYVGIEIVKIYADGTNSTSGFNADSDTGTKSFSANPSKALTKLVFRSEGIGDGSSGSTEQDYSDFVFKLPKKASIEYGKLEKLGMPTGSLNVKISKDNYKSRTYKTEFAGNKDSSVEAFLLENSKGVFVEAESIGSSGNLLPETSFTLKRVLGNELRTISQQNASTQGSAAFFTDPDSRYTLQAVHPEFQTATAVFSPSNYRTQPLRITLAETLQQTTLDVAPLFSGSCKANTTMIECSYDGQVDRIDKALLNVEQYGVAVNETVCTQENTSTQGTLTCRGLNTSEKRYKYSLNGKYGSATTQADAGVLGTKDSPIPLTGLFMTSIIFMIVTSATAFDLRIGIGAGTTTLILANMINWITLTPTQNATLIAVAIIAGVAVKKK